MKSRSNLFLVETEFGKIYLTPTMRYEIVAQTFWPVRPLKVGRRKVYATIGFWYRDEKWIAEMIIRLEELPGRPLPPALEARVTAELARVVSEWAKLNPDVLERAHRRFALDRIKQPRFLLKLRNALRVAMAEVATCKEYADEETAGHLSGAILHMMHLDTEKIPEVYGHIAKINKRRLAAA